MTPQFDSFINKIITEYKTSSTKNELLRILQSLTPQNILDAKEWIKDCQWRNLDPDDVDELEDIEVVRGVQRHYDGGWSQFLLDS